MPEHPAAVKAAANRKGVYRNMDFGTRPFKIASNRPMQGFGGHSSSLEVRIPDATRQQPIMTHRPHISAGYSAKAIGSPSTRTSPNTAAVVFLLSPLFDAKPTHTVSGSSAKLDLRVAPNVAPPSSE